MDTLEDKSAVPDKKRAAENDYALGVQIGKEFPPPALPYRPLRPRSTTPGIGLIGCGGITAAHLRAYRQQGWRVVAVCDRNTDRARARAEEFYPEAHILPDHHALLAHPEVEVVDIATHPAERVALIRDALRARKHVLSQKPFALDLDVAAELVQMAQECGVLMAVNQNGRYAPHFSYIRNAVRSGMVGELLSTHFRVHWNHTWVAGTPFEAIDDLILYDFAVHWFDLAANLWAGRPLLKVHATRARAQGQTLAPPMLAQVLLEVEGGQASFAFDAHMGYGPQDQTYVGGTLGSLISTGPNLDQQSVTLYNSEGYARPQLEGAWFPDGFAGTMGELLCAIEEGRQPENSAADNMRSLALCFAAIASSRDGLPRDVGEVSRLPG